MESVELMAAMHDLAADGPRPAPPETPWEPDALPSTAGLVSRTAINGVLYPLRASRVVLPSALKAVGQLAALPGKVAGGIASTLGGGSGSIFAPTTRFNESASPARVFEARFHDLADFKRIKASVPGATINDVALAYVGGTLRRYLDGHDELPEDTLVAACPASIRDSSEQGRRRQPAVRQSCSRCDEFARTHTNGSHRSPPSPPGFATTRTRRAPRS